MFTAVSKLGVHKIPTVGSKLPNYSSLNSIKLNLHQGKPYFILLYHKVLETLLFGKVFGENCLEANVSIMSSC